MGAGGDGYERPMNAMEAAVRGDHAGPGQCNEGFLREDALLVLVIITDEWDGPGDPELLGSSGSGCPLVLWSSLKSGSFHQPPIVALELWPLRGGRPPW